MTNHWNDYQHSDVFMNIGGNTAENHPISMKWIEKARETKGAKLIVVDPRVSRTAAVSDVYVSIRPGTNIAYLGGLINYILQNEKYHKDYVDHYTNASYLINENYSFDEVTGLFTGAEDDPVRSATKYNTADWQYQRDGDGSVLKDPTFENPNCVLQLMKNHYSNYSIDNVSKMTGADPAALEESYELYSSTGQAGKAGNILYAMGITQFTHGAQNVRACAVVQLLLGNMGIAGGGVNAQRGQSNVQGSTDMAMLYHIVPGYMATPQQGAHPTLEDYLVKETPATSWWVNKPKYFVSLLKAFYGDNATEANEFGYQWMPKLDGLDHSHIAQYRDMGEGKVEGMICWADNPAVSGPSAANKRNYQKNLKWLVSVDVFENETASFWEGPGMNPAEIETEVFILPAAIGYEKEGSKANSGRWIQWGWKAQNPPGESQSDLWIVNELFKRLQALYNAEGGVVPEQITKMFWDYDGPDGQVDVVKVCKDLNGYRTADGSLVTNFVGLMDDGSTACGNWLYSGYYNNYNNPATKSRIKEKEGIGSNLGWSFAWPLNRRIVYNRASCDLEGNPWNPNAPVTWWDEETQSWSRQNDIPDIPGSWSFEQITENPFIMLPEGVGRLYSHSALRDGPFPTHYEPAESLVPNLLYPQATYNPVSQRFYADHTVETDEERERYPYIITTYRVVEHYQSGIVTRNLPWLNELMPELFIEISEELASELGISNGDKVVIESKRLFKDGEQAGIEAKACVTKRFKPTVIDGVARHVVGMPWHWGFKGMSTGAVTNDLTASVGDPNTTIPEYKAFLCNVRRAG
jgi:formate dehydrogenase major subunit